MRLQRVALAVLLLLTGSSCSRDPNVVKQKYLESGNRYFERGKYKEAALMYRNALKKDLRFGEAYYRLGLVQLKLGDGNGARASLTRAVELTKNPDARVQLADLYLSVYFNDPKAEYLNSVDRLVRELRKLDPKSGATYRLQGYLDLNRDKDLKSAIADFRKANDLAPNRPEIMYPLVESLFSDKQPEEAEKVGRLLIEKQKTFSPIYALLHLYYLHTQRLADAENILKEQIANNSKDFEPRLRLAGFYYGSQRKPEMAAVLAKLGSDLPDGHQRAGDFYFRIRDYDNATRQYQEGMRSDPKNKANCQNRIAQVLFAQGKADEASKLLDQILKETPDNQEAKAMRAALAISSGDPARTQQAINELQPLVAQAPRNAPLRYNLARALLIKGDVGQARTQLQEAMKAQPMYLPARLLSTEIRFRAGEYAAAMQEASDILSIDPRNLQAKLYHARALIGLRDLARARQEFEAALKEYPTSSEATLDLASLDLAERKFAAAESLLKGLYSRDSSNTRALMALTEVYASQGQYDKAIQLLKEELAKTPDRADLLSAVANLEVRSGKLDLAIAQFQALLQKNPKSGDLYFRLAETYRLKGDIPAALECFRKAGELRPGDIRPLVRRALLLDENGKKQEARTAYEQVLKLQPDNAIALNNLAYIITESGGDLDQALTLAQRAKQRLPQDPNVSDTLGWIYIRKNLSDSAIEIYRDLVKRQPEVSTFRYHLAMALYQKGDKPQAKKELTQALQKKPSKEEEVKIKELMGKLG